MSEPGSNRDQGRQESVNDNNRVIKRYVRALHDVFPVLSRSTGYFYNHYSNRSLLENTRVGVNKHPLSLKSFLQPMKCVDFLPPNREEGCAGRDARGEISSSVQSGHAIPLNAARKSSRSTRATLPTRRNALLKQISEPDRCQSESHASPRPSTIFTPDLLQFRHRRPNVNRHRSPIFRRNTLLKRNWYPCNQVNATRCIWHIMVQEASQYEINATSLSTQFVQLVTEREHTVA